MGKTNASRSCWSNFESGSSSKDGNCPFFALFLAVIANGLLLLFTTSFLLARLLGSRECSLKRIPVCRVVLRYGSFFINVLTALLIVVFIALIVGFKSKKKSFSGEILDKPHRVYFIVVIAGFVLVLIAAVTSGLLAFKRPQRLVDDEFEDSFNRSYSDHSTTGTTENFLDIN